MQISCHLFGNRYVRPPLNFFKKNDGRRPARVDIFIAALKYKLVHVTLKMHSHTSPLLLRPNKMPNLTII